MVSPNDDYINYEFLDDDGFIEQCSLYLDQLFAEDATTTSNINENWPTTAAMVSANNEDEESVIGQDSLCLNQCRNQ